MRNTINVEIENIEQMRYCAGIDDVALREEIRRLHIGDFVNLTFVADTRSRTGETLLVRITSIRGHAFRGKLANRPASATLAKLRVGSAVAFNTGHIHSLPRGRQTHEGE